MSNHQAADTNSIRMEESGLFITRALNAPRELVYRVWTEAEHLEKWWGPAGMKLEVKQLDVRPGGKFLYRMSTPDGHEMWGKFVYREVTAPEKLVYVSSFSDAEGNTLRAPFSPVFPIEIVNNLTFTEQDGRTTFTLQGGPYQATAEEDAFYRSMFESMKQGFTGTFDQLEAYLAKL